MNYEKKTNIELVNEVEKIQNELSLRDDNLNAYLKRHYTELYLEIERRTINLNKYKKTVQRKTGAKVHDVSIFERIYCLEHELSDRPFCKKCGKNRVNRFIISDKVYGKWCSPTCQASDPDCIAAAKKTCEKLYGDANYNGIEKSRQTRLGKNNGNWHADDFGDKVKARKVANGHDENWNNTEKCSETIAKKIEENPNYWKDRDEKIKMTKVLNGHDENWNNREQFKKTVAAFSKERKTEINNKRANTCSITYGVDCVARIPGVSERKAQTCQKIYGARTALCLGAVRDSSRIALRKDTWDNYINKLTNAMPLMSREEYIACKDLKKEWKWQCKKCGTIFESVWHSGHICKCPTCYPITKRGIQTAVKDYICRLTDAEIDVDSRNVIDGYELDIVDNSQKLAVEVDGLFWHTHEGSIISYKTGTRTTGRDISYHLNKTELCENIGFRLIHFTDDEWLSNRKLCEAVLRQAYGTGLRYIIHDGIEIKHVPIHVKNKFLMKYSFAGSCSSSVDLGIYVRNRLVSIMCFSKVRHSQEYEWQLMRYAKMNFISVENGFSMLLSAFEKEFNPSSVVFYADRRFYIRSDFMDDMVFVKSTRPNFYWVNSKGTEKFKPHEFSKTNIKPYDSTKTFLENMHTLGYKRYFDCGNLVFVKRYAPSVKK